MAISVHSWFKEFPAELRVDLGQATGDLATLRVAGGPVGKGRIRQGVVGDPTGGSTGRKSIGYFSMPGVLSVATKLVAVGAYWTTQ